MPTPEPIEADGVVNNILARVGAGWCRVPLGLDPALPTPVDSEANAAGLAHGDVDGALAPVDPTGRGEVPVLVEGTVVSFVDNKREEAEEVGTGDVPEMSISLH